jgi:FkbM family methyltransferase
VANVARNHLSQVMPLRLAASDRESQLRLLEFDLSDGNHGLARVDRESASSGSSGRLVQGCDLDTVLSRAAVETVDLMKIDIEGAEGLALDGLDRSLRAGRVRHLLLELHPAELKRRDADVQGVTARLREAGYRGWTIDHSTPTTRRVSYARVSRSDGFLVEAHGALPTDSWPHMLWTAPGQAAIWTASR